MTGYVANIEKKSLDNEYFREVLYTAPHSQLVVMSLAHRVRSIRPRPTLSPPKRSIMAPVDQRPASAPRSAANTASTRTDSTARDPRACSRWRTGPATAGL